MQAESRARLLRVLRRMAIGGAIAVGAVALLAGVALALLTTSWGGERVRRLVLPRVNETIAGHLEIGRLRAHLTRIELWDVTLTDPEGEIVAQVAHLEVAAQLRRLLSQQVEVSRVLIERPDLRLVQSSRGLNLNRAMAPRADAPPGEETKHPEPAEPTHLSLALRAFGIREGTIDFRDEGPQPGPPVHVEGLEVAAAATAALPALDFTAQLALDARSTKPLAAPLSLRFEGAGRGPGARGKLRLAWGEARIDLAAASQDAQTQRISVLEIAVPPALVQAFAPGAPLRATIATNGTVARRGDRIDVALGLRAADAHGDLRAGVDVARPGVEGLHLQLADIDLAQLVAGGPPSRFQLQIEAAAAGRDLDTAAGQLRLQIPPGTLDRRAFGPVTLRAEVARGEAVLQALDAALPGLTVNAHGRGSMKALQAEARVKAIDLGLLSRSLRLPASLGLGGHGQLALTASGRPAAAKLALTGQLPALRIAGNELTDLSLSGGTADLSRAPAGTNLRVKLARARAGTQVVRDLDLAVVSVGNDGLRLNLTLAAPLPLSLAAAGRSSGAGSIFDLDSLTLSYPEASWQLTQPVRVRAAAGDLAIGKVDLQAAPDQHISIDLVHKGRRIDAHAALAHVDLGRLPALAQPPGSRLAGLVDLDLQATGRLPRPDATIDLRLVRAGVAGKLDDVGLTLHAQHRAGRVEGKLGATLLGAQHDIDFDLPVAWPPPPSARLHLRAAIGSTDLARLAALGQGGGGKAKAQTGTANAPVPLQGQVAALLAIDGPAADPALSLTATARQLRWGGDRLEDVNLEIADPIGKPLHFDVRTSILGRKSAVQIDTPLVIGSWLRRPPDQNTLLATPFSLRADVVQLPLAPVSPRTRGKPDITGSVSAHVGLTGPVARLHGTLDVDLSHLAGMGIPPTDARLTTHLGEGRQGLDAKLTISRGSVPPGVTSGRPIAELTAALGVGLDDLTADKPLARLAGAKLQINGHVGPLSMKRMVASADGGTKGRRPFRADVEANLVASGRLGDPQVELRVGVQDAQLAGRALGGGRLQLTYRDASPNLNAQLTSAGGGQLTLGAKAKADLSLPALSRGINVSEIPIDAKLASRGFDLTFLSGIADDVRVVEGRLEADAQVTGKAGAPQMVGRIAWNAGRVVLAGFGDIRDIELKAHGDPKQMVLERLFARSGSGTATVTAKAVRDADGRALALDAQADVSKFRVLTEGQPLGALSLAAKAKGTVAPDRIAIASTISEARMELAEGDRRDLQSLKRPDDVVLMSNGEPLDKTQAKRYDELMNRQPLVARTAAPTAAAAAGKSSAPSAAQDQAAGTRITVEAPRNLWVRGADMNLEAGLDPGFIVLQSGKTRVFGTIKVKRGFVEVLGRRFDVATGAAVRFTGPPDRPVLDVDATYKLTQKKSNGDAVSVVVHVEGPADKLSINMSSPGNPGYSDSDLVSMIVTGRVPDEGSAGNFRASDKARSLVGGLVAARVQKFATAILPIDVLNIDSDEQTGQRLEAGTYLSDDVYVAYVGRMGGDPSTTIRENRNELHLEYQLTPRWSFEATYGDARRGSVDLLWTRNY
jgi:translocation and assembly module TamB